MQDNCIDNIFFFGGPKGCESSPSLQVNHLKLNNASNEGNNSKQFTDIHSILNKGNNDNNLSFKTKNIYR